MRLSLSLLFACGATLSACGAGGSFGGSDYGSEDFFVTATVDGGTYVGDSQGAVYYGESEPTYLMLWPSDNLSGYLFNWAPGDQGLWTLSDDLESADAYLAWFDTEMNSYVSVTGSLSIDSWEEHIPENSADTLLGYISGSFDGSFMGTVGGTVTIEDGSFFSMVQ